MHHFENNRNKAERKLWADEQLPIRFIVQLMKCVHLQIHPITIILCFIYKENKFYYGCRTSQS